MEANKQNANICVLSASPSAPNTTDRDGDDGKGIAKADEQIITFILLFYATFDYFKKFISSQVSEQQVNINRYTVSHLWEKFAGRNVFDRDVNEKTKAQKKYTYIHKKNIQLSVEWLWKNSQSY